MTSEENTYSDPLFLTLQYFCVYEISQFCKFLGFSQKQITSGIENQNMVPEFSVYFEAKSLSFAEINPHQIYKPLHSQKLVQGKMLQHKCSEEVKKLVCNKMSSSCWENVKKCFTFLTLNSGHLVRKEKKG